MPVRLTAMMRSHSRCSKSRKLAPPLTPALSSSTSSRPYSRTTAATAASTAGRSRTSSAIAIARPPAVRMRAAAVSAAAASMSAQTTPAPSRARPSAPAPPIPPPAPATSATFPSTRPIAILPVFSSGTIAQPRSACRRPLLPFILVKMGCLTYRLCVISLGQVKEAPMTHIHVIHENAAWLEPLSAALDRRALPWREWFLDRGVFDLSRPPPEGVFYNRMSASSHTRDHRYAAELTASVLAWLTRWGRRVVNGPTALDLEISKTRQYAALEAAGIRTPKTVLVAGKDHLVAATRRHFDGGPVILKPNRGGKGLGVRLFQGVAALADYLDGPEYEPPVDGLHLLQQYVRAPVIGPSGPLITRAEFIGGRFLYGVEVDTSDGFELCPADQCAIDDAFCPAGEEPRAKFTIIADIDPGLKRRYEAFLAANDIEVAGIEFIRDADGTVYTYDVNTNTNYNPEAEARAGRSALTALAGFLGAELAALPEHQAAAE